MKRIIMVIGILFICMVGVGSYFAYKLTHLPIYHFEGEELHAGPIILIPSQTVTTENIKTNFLPFWRKIGSVEQREIGVDGSLYNFKQDGSTYVWYDSGVEMGWQTVYEYKKSFLPKPLEEAGSSLR